jgi:hypothetical protein
MCVSLVYAYRLFRTLYRTFCLALYTCNCLVEFQAVLCWELNRRRWSEFNCVLIPGWDKRVFLFRTVQTGCEVQPLFYPKDTAFSLPQDKTLDMSNLPVTSV